MGSTGRRVGGAGVGMQDATRADRPRSARVISGVVDRRSARLHSRARALAAGGCRLRATVTAAALGLLLRGALARLRLPLPRRLTAQRGFLGLGRGDARVPLLLLLLV